MKNISGHHTHIKKFHKRRKHEAKLKAYNEYLDSEQWRDRRFDYFRSHPNRCEACDTRRELTVHHKTYDSFKEESDEDLCILCRTCHDEYHNSSRRRTTRARTDKWIKKKLLTRNTCSDSSAHVHRDRHTARTAA